MATQQQINHIIDEIISAEEPASVTNGMVGEVLEHLSSGVVDLATKAGEAMSAAIDADELAATAKSIAEDAATAAQTAYNKAQSAYNEASNAYEAAVSASAQAGAIITSENPDTITEPNVYIVNGKDTIIVSKTTDRYTHQTIPSQIRITSQDVKARAYVQGEWTQWGDISSISNFKADFTAFKEMLGTIKTVNKVFIETMEDNHDFENGVFFQAGSGSIYIFYPLGGAMTGWRETLISDTRIRFRDFNNGTWGAWIERAQVLAADAKKQNIVCRIAYYDYANNLPSFATIEDWPALEQAGEVAVGVWVPVDGFRPIIVAPTETNLKWSKYPIQATDFVERAEVYTQQYNGQTNTAMIMANCAALFGNEAGWQQHAAAWCANYSRTYVKTGGTTVGIGIGNWFLPSINEFTVILKYFDQINACLSVINGAQLLERAAGVRYWTSTEYRTSLAWRVLTMGGMAGVGEKITDLDHVRPISYY